MTPPFIHPSAVVEGDVELAPGVQVWHGAHIRAGARIGPGTSIGKDAFVDLSVRVGEHCKIQNGVMAYLGSVIGDGVFLGPGVILTNDRVPRAVNPDGSRKTAHDWSVSGVHVEDGASLGAGTIVIGGVTIGAWALVGAGSVVTHDVHPHELVLGSPARPAGRVCRCGTVQDRCERCGWDGR